jgi:hypothetical protein
VKKLQIRKAIVCTDYRIRAIKPRSLRWTVHLTRFEEGRSTFKIITNKLTGEKPLGRARRR